MINEDQGACMRVGHAGTEMLTNQKKLSSPDIDTPTSLVAAHAMLFSM
jgi:hypothetical protein